MPITIYKSRDTDNIRVTVEKVGPDKYRFVEWGTQTTPKIWHLRRAVASTLIERYQLADAISFGRHYSTDRVTPQRRCTGCPGAD